MMGVTAGVTERLVDEAKALGRYRVCPPRVGVAPSPETVEREYLAQHRTPWRRALSSAKARWYVVACAPQRDYRVLNTLRHDGFEVLLPERIVRRPVDPKANGRRKTVACGERKEPLLPGYLFVRFELEDATWNRIIDTESVDGVLGAKGCPVWLRDRDIEALHRLIADHGVLELRADGSVKRDFVVGEAVRILNDALIAGGWAGVEGQYVGVGDDGRLNIELDMLGRPHVFAFTEALVVERPA